MKNCSLLLFSIFFCAVIAAKPPHTEAKPTPETLTGQGDAAYISYRFSEAANLYAQAKELGCDCEEKIRRAEKAATMLTAVMDIQVIDSQIVAKKDFLQHYPLSPDAGKVYSLGENADGLPLAAFLPERQLYRLTTDTVHGQSDIFISNKLLLDGWTEKQPLSPVINSSANENFPFMMPDGITLYFCSDGENSIGGYDIFVSRFNLANNDFLLPENVGMPFNSPFNDYLLAIDEENQSGCFASDRHQAADTVIIYFFKSIKKDKN